MTKTEVSYLADIAKAEQVEAEITQELVDASALRLENARKNAQTELSEVPLKAQEARRKTSLEAKEKAAVEADKIIKDADERGRKIEAAAESLRDEVFQLVLSRILPDSDGVAQ